MTWGPYLYTTVSNRSLPLSEKCLLMSRNGHPAGVFDSDSSSAQSLLDDVGLADVSRAAEAVKEAVEQQQFEKATELWSVVESVVEQVGTSQSRMYQHAPVWCCKVQFLYTGSSC